MGQTYEIPAFAELTLSKNTSRAIGARTSKCDDEYITMRQQWLLHIENECVRLTAAYHAGNIRIKFDFSLINNNEDIKLAQQHNIDYLGICLLFNENSELNPFNQEQMKKNLNLRRKRWFTGKYVTEARLRREISQTIGTIVQLKNFLAKRAGSQA